MENHDADGPCIVSELVDYSENEQMNFLFGRFSGLVPSTKTSFDFLGENEKDVCLDNLKRVIVKIQPEEGAGESGSANVEAANCDVENDSNTTNSQNAVTQKCSVVYAGQTENTCSPSTVRESKQERAHVFVDTSHAKTSVQVMKLCMNDLGWFEIKNHFQHSSVRAMRVPDIFWHAVSFEDTPCIPFNKNIRINKFPGMVQIVRKQSLTCAIRRLQRLFPEDFQFYPRSWNIPEEYPQLVCDHDIFAADGRNKDKFWFIFKPDDASQGSGIFLEDNPRNIDTSLPRNYLVQEYISNPLLIDGMKFDFRIYVLLRHLKDVEIFISREGMVRFCTVPYQKPSAANKSKVYMHLTNYSLNKYSESYQHTDSMSKGSKRLLSSVFNYLQSQGYNIEKLWAKMEDITVKTIFAILPDLMVAYRDEIPPNKNGPQCFQILGFDILIDDNFEPHLLEVNANPSLNLDHEIEIGKDGVLVGSPAPNHPGYQLVHSQVDEEIKRPVVLESLLLACPEVHRNKTLKFLTKYGVQCAVHYPDGQFSNNDDPIKQDPCLYLVYNCQGAERVEKLRILETITLIYMFVLGNRTNRATHSAFRSFMSKTMLAGSGGGNAASVDLLFIRMTKRGVFYSSNSSSSTVHSASAGLGFDAFVEAFHYLAQQRYKDHESMSLLKKIKMLCQHCFNTLQIPEDFHCYSKTPVGKDEASTSDSSVASSHSGPPKPIRETKKAFLGSETAKIETKVGLLH